MLIGLEVLSFSNPINTVAVADWVPHVVLDFESGHLEKFSPSVLAISHQGHAVLEGFPEELSLDPDDVEGVLEREGDHQVRHSDVSFIDRRSDASRVGYAQPRLSL